MKNSDIKVLRVGAGPGLPRKMAAFLIEFLGRVVDFSASLLIVLVVILSLLWAITSISPLAYAYVSLQASNLESGDEVPTQSLPDYMGCANCEVLARRGGQ